MSTDLGCTLETNTMETPSDADRLHERVRALSISARDCSWATNVEECCEQFWLILEGHSEVDQSLVDAFVHLLRDRDAFALATHMIPELRGEEQAHTSQRDDCTANQRYKDRIIQHTAYAQATSTAKDQAHFDSPLYQHEKEIFALAELDRARIAFESSRPMTAEQKEEFRKWWFSCPLITSPRKSTDAEGNRTVAAAAFDAEGELCWGVKEYVCTSADIKVKITEEHGLWRRKAETTRTI